MGTHSLFPARYTWEWGFPDGSAGKESICNAGDTGDMGSVPGSGRSPSWMRAWQPTPVFLLGKPMDRGIQQATIHGVAKNWT